MANRAVLACVDETCQKIMHSSLPFGGKVIVLLGDFAKHAQSFAKEQEQKLSMQASHTQLFGQSLQSTISLLPFKMLKILPLLPLLMQLVIELDQRFHFKGYSMQEPELISSSLFSPKM